MEKTCSVFSKIKKPVNDELFYYSPVVIRTPDPVVNSHLLCQLSYRGINAWYLSVKKKSRPVYRIFTAVDNNASQVYTVYMVL